MVDCVTAAFGVFVPQIGKPPAPMLADYAALIARRQVHVVEDEGIVAAVIVLTAQAELGIVAAQRQAGLRELMTAFGEVEDHRIPPWHGRCCSCWWPGLGSSRARSPASTDG